MKRQETNEDEREMSMEQEFAEHDWLFPLPPPRTEGLGRFLEKVQKIELELSLRGCGPKVRDLITKYQDVV